MTARYVLLRIANDVEADRFLLDLARYPSDPLLSPVQENTVHVEVVPGIDASDAERSFGTPGWSDSLTLEAVVRWSCERGPVLAAEWETSS